MKQMRISDNVELPASFMDLLVKSEGSLVDPFQGNARSEENSEAVEPIDEEDQFEELEPQDIEKMDKDVNLNTAGSYKFSSVKTIHEYARDIWMIELVVLP
ncbi:hypothetical protein LOK49_LG11G01036 [Camellia lanceoleosa]|uniref:Uncharacterized protein n=1 Tax=Camellia lanceoleosa TaxID=1840588 RepID=A0ACC0G5U8_9ERIC|nr:hypothetical protein LOK49_LG11G01036 [Camellia lanceoleosa]